MLRDAQDQQQLMVDHVAEEVRKIVDPKTVKKLEATTHTFTTERGEKLTLSTAQVMELYELVKRKAGPRPSAQGWRGAARDQNLANPARHGQHPPDGGATW